MSDPLSEIVNVGGVSFTRRDLFTVVDKFYGRVQDDPLLRVPFGSVSNWSEHIERLTHFWWIRFGGQPYMFISYDPVEKHYSAGFNRILLDRWLGLFHETLVDCLNQEQVRIWTLVTERMGDALSMKNEAYRNYMNSVR